VREPVPGARAGGHVALGREYLAERATLEEMRWFLRQEVAGEAGFDDLVALMRLNAGERSYARYRREFARSMAALRS
jgi:hypothetical protein